MDPLVEMWPLEKKMVEMVDCPASHLSMDLFSKNRSRKPGIFLLKYEGPGWDIPIPLAYGV